MTLRASRRETLGGLSALGLAASGLPTVAGAADSKQPNIIFIMADDLGYADLGCTGARIAVTPHIDSIATNGMLFEQGYANSAICSPTRTALFTGCYQHRFPVGLPEPIAPPVPGDIGVPFDRETLAEVMRSTGYETALVGKWHLGEPPAHNPLRHGYDHFFGIIPGGADYFRHRVVIGGRDIGPSLMENENDVERVGYLTDHFGDEAVRRIREKSKPLFMSLHFTAPHWPWEGREDEEVSRTLGDFFHYDGGSIETYYKMVSAMDDNVGKVLKALADIGEFDNSIIVFTSDNGGERFSDTWPFIGVKGELLEGGIRVPILCQWKDQIAPGQTSQQVMTSMDFLPTLLSMAGGELPDQNYDGMDLSPHLLGQAGVTERTLYWRMRANDQAAVRKGNWKYLRIGGKDYLFDLSKDQRERANLVEHEPDRLSEMKSLWDAWNGQMLPYPLGSPSQDNSEFMADRY